MSLYQHTKAKLTYIKIVAQPLNTAGVIELILA